MQDFFFLLHRACSSAFSVELLHLPLLLTNHEADFRLREGSAGWITPSFVDPPMPGSAANQELGCS